MQTLLTRQLQEPQSGDALRRQKGREIAAAGNIRRDDRGFTVPADTGVGSYFVDLEGTGYCSCDDWHVRQRVCKHIFAVLLDTGLLDDLDGEVDEALPRYRQSWASYTAAQVAEGRLFPTLLRELCNTVPQPPQAMGRPRLPLGDMLYACCMKVYSTVSTRRAMSSIADGVEGGLLEAAPSHSAVIRYLENPELRPIIRALLQQSALPLRSIEDNFAVDSTGFSALAYERYFDHKWGGRKRMSKWVKLHAMCGVLTNVITDADATFMSSNDAPYLRPFLDTTAQHFNVREVYADKAYSSRANLHAIDDLGATPYIPFGKRATPRPNNKYSFKHQYDPLWERLLLHFRLHADDFNLRYHLRSNVETTFMAVKSKFGDRVRSRTPNAMVNEALLKCLAYNITVVIKAIYALGLEGEVAGTFSSKAALDAKVA